MPRTYKPRSEKQYKKYHELLIAKALREYNSSNKSLSTISQKYNISKSVLHRHNTGIMKKQGGQTALTPEVEEYLLQYINICSERGYPLKTIEFRLLIKGYLDTSGLEVKKFKNNMPSPDYIQCFMKRHKDKIMTQNIKINHRNSTATVIPKIIYYDELQVAVLGIPG